MATFSGTTSGSSQDDLQQLMDQRKRKRTISNRESARRSRMRKQKHCDDLMAQLSQLKDVNNQIVTNLNMVTHLYVNVEAENSILKAQVDELSHRLQALNKIINCNNSSNLNFATSTSYETEDYANYYELMTINNVNGEDDFLNPWNLLHVNQSIMNSF